MLCFCLYLTCLTVSLCAAILAYKTTTMMMMLTCVAKVHAIFRDHGKHTLLLVEA